MGTSSFGLQLLSPSPQYEQIMSPIGVQQLATFQCKTSERTKVLIGVKGTRTLKKVKGLDTLKQRKTTINLKVARYLFICSSMFILSILSVLTDE